MIQRNSFLACVSWTLGRASVLAAGAALVACVVEHDDTPRYLGSDPGAGSGGTTSSNGSSEGTAPAAPADAGGADAVTSGASGADGGASLAAVVDTNRSLNAVAGQGVGVFVAYDSGGHWDITWTCDTALSGDTCDFALLFSVVGGAVPTNVQVYGNPVLPAVQGGVAVTSTTGSTIDGVTFDTAPGATMEMTTKLSGEPNSAIVFFVQDGQVNGGFSGTLPDPLDFVGSTP